MQKQLPTYPFYGFLFIFFISPFLVFSQENLDAHKRAASGYDVVEYFNNTPTVGNSNFQVEYQDAIYLFKNQTNKALFEANPNRRIDSEIPCSHVGCKETWWSKPLRSVYKN